MLHKHRSRRVTGAPADAQKQAMTAAAKAVGATEKEAQEALEGLKLRDDISQLCNGKDAWYVLIVCLDVSMQAASDMPGMDEEKFLLLARENWRHLQRLRAVEAAGEREGPTTL